MPCPKHRWIGFKQPLEEIVTTVFDEGKTIRLVHKNLDPEAKAALLKLMSEATPCEFVPIGDIP